MLNSSMISMIGSWRNWGSLSAKSARNGVQLLAHPHRRYSGRFQLFAGEALPLWLRAAENNLARIAFK
jgi:hypothetical protein